MWERGNGCISSLQQFPSAQVEMVVYPIEGTPKWPSRNGCIHGLTELQSAQVETITIAGLNFLKIAQAYLA
jgi:hypothetical protein